MNPILNHIHAGTLAKFAALVRKTDACWEWQGKADRNGYGRMSVSKNTKILAHRFAYAAHHQVEPGGMCVCHHCDNPACVNPAHLFLGTHADNAADKVRKGRAPSAAGERNPNAKLCAADLASIRLATAAGVPNTEVAKLFGVHHSTVSAIKRGVTWASQTRHTGVDPQLQVFDWKGGRVVECAGFEIL
jgi:hypothetical protein